MRYKDIKPGMKVKDRWFTDSYINYKGETICGWGFGKVIKKLKTVVHIRFPSVGMISFDISHLQFLDKV